MAIIRAQVVLPYLSGKPEDVAVNTWHFSSGTAAGADLELARDHLVEAYTVAPPNGPSGNALSPLGAHLSNAISRVTFPARIKLYDLAAPMPRPVTEFTFTLPTSINPTADEMPAEVALCGSFYALRNLPRQRGRIYFGPFTVNATQDEPVNQRAHPRLQLRETIHGLLKRLISKPANTVNLAVYSRMDNVARAVTAGWVDDAFDTQRRRGQDASGRLPFP